jgi:broad specificity phosphatase PhoE
MFFHNQGGPMKWPAQLVLIRHAESAYNILRAQKAKDPLYAAFLKAYNKDYRSADAKDLAQQVMAKYSLRVSDASTLITQEGATRAFATGAALKGLAQIPDVVLASPYVRTKMTLERMQDAWPDLRTVKVVSEDRIREQEHGLSLLYSDYRVFYVMHPEQKQLHDLQGQYWYQYPQGESVSNVRARIRSVLNTLVREYSGQRVMLVTHHLTILSIRAILERLTPEEFIRLDEEEKPINCGVTIYRGVPTEGKDGRLLLDQYNVKLY